jgi:hypothetical protein
MAFERTPRAISHAEAHKPHKDPQGFAVYESCLALHATLNDVRCNMHVSIHGSSNKSCTNEGRLGLRGSCLCLLLVRADPALNEQRSAAAVAGSGLPAAGFFSGATDQLGRFTEGFLLRRLHSIRPCHGCSSARR